jgi:CBS domain-containing protein
MGILEEMVESGQPIRTVSPHDSVLDAVGEICRWHVRAVIVGSVVDPVGILCERDVLERLVLAGLDPAVTRVDRIMSKPVVCLPATSTAEEALAYMHEHRFHQVPVAGQEALLGVISASDLRRWAMVRQAIELDALTSYVTLGR